NDDAAGGDKSLFADLDVFQESDIHSNNSAPLHEGTFHDGAVADGAICFDNGRSFARMNDALVLHARASTHHDRTGILIRSQDRSPPDTRFVADRNVADQNSGGGNKS